MPYMPISWGGARGVNGAAYMTDIGRVWDIQTKHHKTHDHVINIYPNRVTPDWKSFVHRRCVPHTFIPSSLRPSLHLLFKFIHVGEAIMALPHKQMEGTAEPLKSLDREQVTAGSTSAPGDSFREVPCARKRAREQPRRATIQTSEGPQVLEHQLTIGAPASSLRI